MVSRQAAKTRCATLSRMLLCALLAAVAFSPAVINSQDEQPEEYRPPRKFSFGLIGVALREDLTVYQGGARDADGNIVIQQKDRLMKWNGEELKTLDDFCRNLYETKPGDIVEVEISRPTDGDEREVLTVKAKLGDPRESYKELYTHLDKRKRDYDWRDNEAVTQGGPLRDQLWPQIEKQKLDRPWDDLIAAHERELDLWDSYENLSSTELLLSDPLAAHQWIDGLGKELAKADTLGLQLGNLRAPMMTLLDRDPGPHKDMAEFPAGGGPFEAMLDELVSISAPTEADEVKLWADLRERVASFQFAWRGQEGFADSARVVGDMRDTAIDVRAPISILFSALEWLVTVAQSLHKDKPVEVAPDGVDMSTFVQGDAFCIRTSFGLAAVGGTGRNVWTGGTGSPAVIIDLGGDDEYIDCAVTDGERLVSTISDLGGNDQYRSTGKWGVACGMLGTAIIDDHEGDDTYECGDWGIGAAFGGVGLLIDRKGNDRYLGGSNSIGCAAYGIGGVIDLEGNDLYDSKTYSVGCGQPGGVGFVLDHSGDDRYRCTGGEPSPYGTEGEWFGGGIGCGFGWRTLACGGIGLVVDVKGNDIYDAGEFGLACGYFMGVGAVRDMDGDDIYHSSRYGLAAAAHAAVGVFMDDKGNDVYEGKTAASIGGTWDIVTGYFYDGAGNDVYRCNGLGLGACAQNGFGIFWDAGGADYYRGARSTLGHAGKAEYGGGRLAKNFGIFMDTGGGKDTYPRDHKNGSEVLRGEYGLFLDE